MKNIAKNQRHLPKVQDTTRDDEFRCPLLCDIIPLGFCYDIQMIRMKMIKPSIIEYEIEHDKADVLCISCSFNPFPQ